MTTRNRVTASLCGALSLALVLAGCAVSSDKAGGTQPSEPVVLTMPSPTGGVEAQPFVDEVARLSKGLLRIDLQSGWHRGDLTKEADVIRYVQGGKAPLGIAPARAFHDAGVRGFDALIAPLEVDSYALQQRILQSDLVDPMLHGTAALGLEGFGVLPGPMRKPVGTTRLLLGPADYRDATIGMSSSAVAARALQVLGATPVPSGFEGAPIGQFAGIELQIASVDGNQYDGVATSITANVNLWPRPLVLFANAKAFSQLSPANQDILRRAAQTAIPVTLRAQVTDEKETLGNLCRRGKIRFVTASQSQLDQLHRQLTPVDSWLQQDPVTKQSLARIRSLHAEGNLVGPAEPAPSCSGVTGTTATPGLGGHAPLDGVYEVTTTAQDLAAAGAQPDEVVPENYGTTVLVVDRGRFASTQENSQACTWTYGTWAVNGQQVKMTFTDGGGLAPSGAVDKPGEVFDFGWSLYRDTLTFTAVPGSISPTPFRALPWRRISTAPTSDRFSKRCPPPAVALRN